MQRTIDFAAFWLIAQLTLINFASAFNYSWNNSAGGAFETDSNWTKPIFVTGYPDDGTDTAIFSLFAVYTVNFNADRTNNNVIVNTGTVTWDLYDEPVPPFPGNGLVDYTLDATTGPAALVGSIPGSLFPATLIVDGSLGAFLPSGKANVVASQALHIGSAADSVGAVELEYANWSSASPTMVGLNGVGSLQINSSAELTNGDTEVGSGPGSTGTVTNAGDWTINGDLTVGNVGDGVVTNSGTLTSHNTVAIAAHNGSSGTINIQHTWNTSGPVYVGGNSSEAGGVGRLAIGSNGSVAMGADWTMWSGGTLALEEGAELVVAGMANLDGTLEFLLDAMTVPQLSDEYLILTATAGVLGSFNLTILPPLDGGLRWEVDYKPTSVSLRVAPAFTADFDLDGDVDGRDFLVWQRGESPNGTSSGDLALWQGQYGNTTLASLRSVPELGSSLLLLLAFGSLSLNRRRRAGPAPG